MRTGTVKWFDAKKGFGFITPEDGASGDVRALLGDRGTGYRTLKDGSRVEFDTVESPKASRRRMSCR